MNLTEALEALIQNKKFLISYAPIFEKLGEEFDLETTRERIRKAAMDFLALAKIDEKCYQRLCKERGMLFSKRNDAGDSIKGLTSEWAEGKVDKIGSDAIKKIFLFLPFEKAYYSSGGNNGILHAQAALKKGGIELLSQNLQHVAFSSFAFRVCRKIQEIYQLKKGEITK